MWFSKHTKVVTLALLLYTSPTRHPLHSRVYNGTIKEGYIQVDGDDGDGDDDGEDDDDDGDDDDVDQWGCRSSREQLLIRNLWKCVD